MVGSNPRVVSLDEQIPKRIALLPEEASFLKDTLSFDVVDSGQLEAVGSNLRYFLVNPHQFVGHFILSTGTIVVITPKIPAASVFRMLAYVYISWKKDLLRDADVLYEKDSLLFEPLVELFNRIVEQRIRHGLAQNYVSREDNLPVLKGRLRFGAQIQENEGRHPERVCCRFFENTCDIEDNQIVKWTISKMPSFLFSSRTARNLKANFHQFEPVSLVRPAQTFFDRRHYHRLNEDYRLIHGLCQLFLEGSSISEKVGEIRFRGFLLDMNYLFERFVTQAFVSQSTKTQVSIFVQSRNLLFEAAAAHYLVIEPDIVAKIKDKIVSIVDAKYKRAAAGFENQDFYQVVSYATALSCSRTHLFYPASGCDIEGVDRIKNSSIQVVVHSVDIESKECVLLIENLAREILQNDADLTLKIN